MLDGNMDEARIVLEKLVEEKYVDDYRYSCAYARDKASIAGWGAVKIRYMLRAKGVAGEVIDAAIEEIDESKPYTLFDPDFTWKRKEVENFVARKMLVPVFVNGECVYDEPDIDEIRDYCSEQIDNLWEEVKRFENPHEYYVDLSPKLWKIKDKMLKEHNKD